MKRLPSSLETESDPINLTPLLDVLFVVLILFMLAAPLLQIDHVKLSNGAPSKESFSDITPQMLKITVSRDNHIQLNNKEIAIPLLIPTLRAIKMKFPTFTPIVYHDEAASFGTYQILKNALEEAGFDEMDIILQAK
ncbi:MAG: biopolymer transporter ExbD [Simkaniaceae bacterium]|nr:biopolymer transporter ExbD [Simkaniaceae bacterium]